eukprot:scaffold450_cov105-Skeletonema_marinoi.AAC.1
MDIKVTTYNIHSCIGTDNLYFTDRIAAVIQGDQSDIVCLQEVEVNNVPTKTRIWSHIHGDDQPALIASKAGLKYHVFVPAIRSKADSKWKERHQNVSDLDVSGNITMPAVLSSAENNLMERQPLNHNIDSTMYAKFGIAILSKFPIRQIRTHYYIRYKKKTQRNAMACLIELPNKKQVWVVNTHLGCHFIGREQAQQARELALFVHSLQRDSCICAVITCGDFNSPPWFSCTRELKRQGLRDVWQHKRRFGGTFPSHEQAIGMPFIGKCFRKLLRLDYIFLYGGVVCKIAYVYDGCSDASLASDHLPVCAVLFIDNKINREQK